MVVAMQKMKNLVLQDVQHKSPDDGNKSPVTAQGATGGPP